MKKVPVDRLVLPVEIVARELPGDHPPAIRMRLAAKEAKRRHGVDYRAYLSTEDVKLLREQCQAYDLETLEPITETEK